jgi:hypothetical protein
MYFKIITKVYPDGRKDVGMQVYRILPESGMRNISVEMKNFTLFHDWFDIEEEANDFMEAESK